jgi:hypothetical protein
MTEIGIKGASGLGDNLYLYPIAKHYSTTHDKVYLMSDYPVLFEPLPKVECFRHLKLNYIPIREGEKIRKKEIDVRCTYGPRKHIKGTSQFEDMYIFANERFGQSIPKLKLEMPWEIKNKELIDTIKLVASKNGPRKIAVVAAPYQPFGREDKWGDEIKIAPETIQYICDELKLMNYLVITVGNEFSLLEPMVEYNLINQTSVEDLLDLVYISDLCVTQIGNLLPMAEVFGKKNITIFSHNISNCEHKFLRAITPDKCVHYKNLNLSFNDDKISKDRIHEFCHQRIPSAGI